MRATLARSRRLAFYGVALPGIYRASNLSLLFSERDVTVRELERSTRFALQLGAGLILVQSGPYAVRAELSRLIYALGRGENAETHESLGPRQLGNGWDLNVGIIRRSGAPVTHTVEGGPARPRWTLGSQTGATVATGPVVAGTAGAFASYRLSRFCDFDASISTFVRNAILEGAGLEGGSLAQGLAGVKLGVRSDRIGVFFKARAGVHSYSHALNLRGDPSAGEFYRRGNVPAIDIGGVVEAYGPRRLVMRFDVGESLSLFPAVRSHSDVDEDQPLPQVTISTYNPARQFYTIPMRVGIGVRF